MTTQIIVQRFLKYILQYNYIDFYMAKSHNPLMNMESFEWDLEKDIANQLKHGVSFDEAQYVFDDPYKIIVSDVSHSLVEERFFCIGKIEEIILTVRFTHRENKIRIIGAAAWRRGKKIYEKENRIQ
mgnify:CR=1 FL=1|jgi:uncharacterized protein